MARSIALVYAHFYPNRSRVGRRLLAAVDDQASGMHGRPFTEFVAPLEQTARFCGMHWGPPLIVHSAHHCVVIPRLRGLLEPLHAGLVDIFCVMSDDKRAQN